MKKNWLKWALCLVLAVGLLTCVASAAIAQNDLAAISGGTTTITVNDQGKLTVTTPGTTGTQYVLFQVKLNEEDTTLNLATTGASALLTSAQAAVAANKQPYAALTQDSIIYIDQTAGADNTVKWENFLPKTTATSLFVLGGDAQPKVIGAMVGRGVTVGGTVNVKGATSGAAKVELMEGTSVVNTADVTVGANGTVDYSFDAVPAGDYTLKVSSTIVGVGNKVKYVPRTYSVTVGGDAVTQDVVIYPKGDANNDGKVNTSDLSMVLSHVKHLTTLTDYNFACSNINGDTAVNASDLSGVLSQVKNLNGLW